MYYVNTLATYYTIIFMFFIKNEENTNNSTTRSSQLSDDKMTLSEMEAKICKINLKIMIEFVK